MPYKWICHWKLCFLYVTVIVLYLALGSKSDSPGEQLVESMGSWAAGFCLSPGEKSEQEYLLALSAQYQVEYYEDCYNLMGQLKTYDCAKGTINLS